MAKRFTDTGKWKKKWIRELDPKYKLFWFYLLDNCDHAGVFDADIASASFHIGLKYSEKEILDTFNRKIIILKKDKWFIPKFVEYQYGELNENNRAHLSVIKILKKYKLLGASKGLNKVLNGDKDQDKDKVKDKKNDQIKKINLSELKDQFPNKNVELEFAKWNDYMLSKGKTYKNYSAAFRNWLRNNQFTAKNIETFAKQFKKTPTGLFIAYCEKCKKQHYPSDYQLKQSSSCCGVDWVPNIV